MHAFIKLQEKMERQSIKTSRWYRKGDVEAIPVPVLGPDLIDVWRAQEIADKVGMTVTLCNPLTAPPARE